MVTKSSYGLKGNDRDSYLELVLAFSFGSIKSEEHLEASQEVTDQLRDPRIGVLRPSVLCVVANQEAAESFNPLE